MPRTLLSILFCPLLVGFLASMGCATAIPSEKGYMRSLDGMWRFKIERKSDRTGRESFRSRLQPPTTPYKPEPFERLDYKEDPAWHDVTVPGNWEMAGDSPATYNQPDDAIGLYRLWFDVPAAWAGRIVKINFDGVQNAAEVFLNGQPVNVDEPSWGRNNYHESGFTAFQADLTAAVRFGDRNLLAVRVTKNTKSVDLDTGDYFLLAGIYRTVTLFSVPATYISDYAVHTKLTSGSSEAELHVLVNVTSPTAAARISMQLEGHPAMEAALDSHGHAKLVQKVDNPKLWSAEHPNLHQLSLDLKNGSRRLEHVSQRIGLREVSIRNGIFMVNNVPVKLAGMCRHEHYATLGSALNDEAWRKDIMLMKAANVNAIRTSHYPYASRFYDLCDELGMYVADEMAACWCPTTSASLAPAFAQRAREMVRRDKIHPCVIIWAVGNENKPGKNNKVAADEIRKLDPTIPRLVSWRDVEEAGVELDDRHYTPPDEIRKANSEPRRSTIPITYLENPNSWEIRNGADYGCTDRWAAVIDRTWREVLNAEHVPGTFHWEWADRAIVDKSPIKLYDYFPRTGINLVKVKGICDAFRNPRAWYYHIKMTYAPIVVNLTPQLIDESVVVNVTNHYSFTDLSELKTTWRLLKGRDELRSGTAVASLAPRSTGQIKLALPVDALADADALRLAFDSPNGTNVATYQLRLKPEPDNKPQLSDAPSPDIAFPRLTLTAVKFPNNDIGWRYALRRPASLTNISVERTDGTSSTIDERSLNSLPLSEVQTVEADVQISDGSTTNIVGDLRVSHDSGHLAYEVNWSGAKADIQELGWAFLMPESSDHFSWHRQAYWSYYPEDHIGRSEGTATPDSADIDVTKVTRPDAFDFNSTKFDCDWATLTRQDGSGIGVTFSADDRHHCRAGTLEDGSRVLFVNKQCSPPRDISSNIVKDYYLELEPGSRISGSFKVGAIPELKRDAVFRSRDRTEVLRIPPCRSVAVINVENTIAAEEAPMVAKLEIKDGAGLP